MAWGMQDICKPWIDAVLDRFLAIFPPSISIIKNIIHTPRLEGEPRPGCFSTALHSLPPLLPNPPAAAPFFFLRHYNRRGGGFRSRVMLADAGRGGEKVSPVDVSEDLRLWRWEVMMKRWVHGGGGGGIGWH